MLGKLITHEFAFGIQFPGHRFQPAKNPWNLDHMPGGSSSGSAAALAAGLVHGALGSDTGGSIRGPAAFCSLVGLKPTYGRVSRAGVLTLSWSLDHTGPMARTVEDCALLLQALAGHDPADPASSREPVADYAEPLGRGIRGLRVGVPRAYFLEGADAEVEKAFEQALAALRLLGAVWDPSFGFPKSNMPPFNMTGLPALAVPCGFSSQGLPLSLQIAGRPFDEATVLRVGHAYEQATEWHRRRPRI